MYVTLLLLVCIQWDQSIVFILLATLSTIILLCNDHDTMYLQLFVTQQDSITHMEVTASDLMTALDDVTGTSATFGNILSLFLNLKFFLLN